MKWSLISLPHFIRMLLSSGLFFGQILMRDFKIYWQKWKRYPVHFTFVAYSSGDEQTILEEISILKYCANYVKILSVVYAFFKMSNISVICFFFQSSQITKFLFSWVSIGLHWTKTNCCALRVDVKWVDVLATNCQYCRGSVKSSNIKKNSFPRM